MSSIIKQIQKQYPSRYKPYDFQRKVILAATKKRSSLLKMDVGTGKTLVSWYMALAASINWDVTQILILCPPTLIRQWYEFVKEFDNIPSVCAYQGTPKQRQAMDLSESVIIMGYQILIKDFEKIGKQFYNRNIFIICDEVSLRDSATKTYKILRFLFYGVGSMKGLNDMGDTEPVRPFTLLNATPVSNPGQTYGYIRLLTPIVYGIGSKWFESRHVAKKNQYNKAVAYKNLDELEEQFKLRRFDADADKLLSLPPVTYIPIRYDLEPRHFELYQKMVQHEVSAFPNVATKNMKEILGLFTRLQQLVTNPDMFDYDYSPAYLDLLDERLEELGPDEKVIIYAHFKATNRKILNHLGKGAVGLWSDFNQTQKNQSEDAFRKGVNRLVAHCKSGGIGLNLQHARHEIFVEIPPDPPTFKQAVGRIHRDGQQKKQFVAIFLASGTIQERIYYNLIVKDKLLAEVMGDKKSLQDFLL
jgi:SNF2 family DNA or RNA helicase